MRVFIQAKFDAYDKLKLSHPGIANALRCISSDVYEPRYLESRVRNLEEIVVYLLDALSAKDVIGNPSNESSKGTDKP